MIFTYTRYGFRGEEEHRWTPSGQEVVDEAGGELLCLTVATDHLRDKDISEIHVVVGVANTAEVARGGSNLSTWVFRPSPVKQHVCLLQVP